MQVFAIVLTKCIVVICIDSDGWRNKYSQGIAPMSEIDRDMVSSFINFIMKENFFDILS